MALAPRTGRGSEPVEESASHAAAPGAVHVKLGLPIIEHKGLQSCDLTRTTATSIRALLLGSRRTTQLRASLLKMRNCCQVTSYWFRSGKAASATAKLASETASRLSEKQWPCGCQISFPPCINWMKCFIPSQHHQPSYQRRRLPHHRVIAKWAVGPVVQS